MLSSFNSQKFRFWAFISMVLLVFVHGYNLNNSYLQPWTIPGEPLTITGFTEYWLANGLFRFRIPMLFIISGYLFAMGDTKPHKSRIGKRVKTLLYPYLIWSAFGLLLTYCLEQFNYGSFIVAQTHMMQIDETRILLHQYHWYEVVARWLLFPAAYQLWFIRVLLIYNLAYPALIWCISNPRSRWIFFTIAILFWIATTGLILLEGEGLLFFTLGIWMQKKNFNIDTPNKWLQPKYWVVVFFATSILKTIIAFKGYFDGIEPMLLLLHKATVISGLITAWYGGNFLVRYFMKHKWFVWLSAFSFMIYVLHAPMVVYLSKAAILQTSNIYGYRIICFIMVPFFLVASSVLIGFLLRKISPKLYGLLTGGRGLT